MNRWSAGCNSKDDALAGLQVILKRLGPLLMVLTLHLDPSLDVHPIEDALGVLHEFRGDIVALGIRGYLFEELMPRFVEGGG